MKTWIDFDDAPVFAIPLTGGTGVFEGMLIEGPQGWGEFSPPKNCPDERAARWLTAAIEVGTVGWPDPVRGRVPVAVSIPALDPASARTAVVESGCGTAVLHVGSGPLSEDIARAEAVRDALGPDGAIRIDADGRWDPEAAAAAVPQLERAAGGLQFVEQPCRTLAETAALRRMLDIPVALDQSLRDAADPVGLDLADVADIAVLTVSPLGGVRRALRVAESCGLPCVVAGSLETSIGSAGGPALAGVLPDSGYAHELGIVSRLDGDVVSAARSLIVTDGWLPVAPMPPGPDRVRLERFRLTDAGSVRSWRDRLSAVQRYL